MGNEMEKIRLQKYLAQCGIASRRACEDMIRAGRVTVNDEKVTEMGFKVDPEAALICVDGRPVYLAAHKVYYILNKPMGVICAASDPFGRRTVIDCLEGVTERIYPVGRLDYETEGLLLLTNDGDFAHRVLHPSFEVEKTYYTVVIGRMTPEAARRLRQGVRLEDGVTAPAKVQILHRSPTSTTLALTIHEGRNRQVRRMMEAVGYGVQYLRRDKLGALTLEGLPTGAWRSLTQRELSCFMQENDQNNLR